MPVSEKGVEERTEFIVWGLGTEAGELTLKSSEDATFVEVQHFDGTRARILGNVSLGESDSGVKAITSKKDMAEFATAFEAACNQSGDLSDVAGYSGDLTE